MLLIIGAVIVFPISSNQKSHVIVTNDYLEIPPQLGVVVDQNLMIIDIEHGSAAEQAGLQVGDIIKVLGTAVVTSPVTAMQTAHQTFSSMKPGDAVQIVLSRKGQELNIKAHLSVPSHPGQPTPTAVPEGYTYF